MTAHANLLRMDYETVAERIRTSIVGRGRPLVVLVRSNGRVRCEDRSCVEASDAAEFVGCYTAATPIEHIESDLIARLRELSAPTDQERV